MLPGPISQLNYSYTSPQSSLSLPIVSVQHEGWCWKEKSLATVVGPDIDPVLQFSQLGFVLECAVSHDIRMVSRISFHLNSY